MTEPSVDGSYIIDDPFSTNHDPFYRTKRRGAYHIQFKAHPSHRKEMWNTDTAPPIAGEERNYHSTTIQQVTQTTSGDEALYTTPCIRHSVHFNQYESLPEYDQPIYSFPPVVIVMLLILILTPPATMYRIHPNLRRQNTPIEPWSHISPKPCTWKKCQTNKMLGKQPPVDYKGMVETGDGSTCTYVDETMTARRKLSRQQAAADQALAAKGTTAQIMVRTFEGKVIMVEMTCGDTCAHVKERIQDKTGVPAGEFKLSASGHEITEEAKVGEEPLTHAAWVVMVSSMLGGGRNDRKAGTTGDYVVFNGRETGVFTNVVWDKVIKPLVDGFSGGAQSRFDTARQAKEAWESALTDPEDRNHQKVPDEVRRKALCRVGIAVEKAMLRGDEEKRGGRGRDLGFTGGSVDRGHRIGGRSGERDRGDNSGSYRYDDNEEGTGRRSDSRAEYDGPGRALNRQRGLWGPGGKIPRGEGCR
jgi:hypothetical protein